MFLFLLCFLWPLLALPFLSASPPLIRFSSLSPQAPISGLRLTCFGVWGLKALQGLRVSGRNGFLLVGLRASKFAVLGFGVQGSSEGPRIQESNAHILGAITMLLLGELPSPP